MKLVSLKSRLGVALVLLLSTKVSSSFVPRCHSALKMNSSHHHHLPLDTTTTSTSTSSSTSTSLLTVRGGSEESNLEGSSDAAVPPPVPAAQSPPPESIPAEIPPPVQSQAAAVASLLGPNAPPPGFLRRNFPSLPWHRLPNFLTYMRCIAIPALIILFYQPKTHIAVGILFAFASFTDWLDGYLARRWDISSAFGAFLDPVADKLMVSTSLVLLAGRYGAPVAIPATIILAREIAVSALREWMAQKGQRDVVKVGYQGKVKTALTMVALTVLLFVPTGTETTAGFLSNLYSPGLIMLYLCSVVTITSGSVYFLAAAPLLMEDAKQ